MAERLKSGLQIEDAAGADLVPLGFPPVREEVEQVERTVIPIVREIERRRCSGSAPMHSGWGTSRGSEACTKGSATRRAMWRWGLVGQATACDKEDVYVGIEFDVI